MKKFALIGLALAGSLVMAGCAEVEYKGPRPAPIGPVDGVSQSDQDQNNRSAFNDDLYCDGDTYVPLPNNEFQCEDRDGHTKKPTPKVTIPKVTTQAKPAVPATPAVPAKPAVPAPKPAAPKPAAPAPKPAAPAPYKAPAKTGK